MENLNNEIAITDTNEDFVLRDLEEVLSVDLEEIAKEIQEAEILTEEEKAIVNATYSLPMDRVCAMFGIHKETVEAILKKVN